jgi:hypothetical protein
MLAKRAPCTPGILKILSHFGNQAEKGRKRIRLNQRTAGVSLGRQNGDLGAHVHHTFCTPHSETEACITTSNNNNDLPYPPKGAQPRHPIYRLPGDPSIGPKRGLFPKRVQR